MISQVYNRKMTWILCGVCLILIIQMSDCDPLNRLMDDWKGQSANEIKTDVRSTDHRPTTISSPNLVTPLEPPTTETPPRPHNAIQLESSGITSNEKWSGDFSKESVQSGGGSQERSHEQISGAFSKESLSPEDSSSQSLSGDMRITSSEQSSGGRLSMATIVGMHRTGLRHIHSRESSKKEISGQISLVAGSTESGKGSRQSGAGSIESGGGSRESGGGSRESGRGSSESDRGLAESGIGSRESGVGSRESGVGSKESGAGSKESHGKSKESGIVLSESVVGPRDSRRNSLHYRAIPIEPWSKSIESGGGSKESSGGSKESEKWSKESSGGSNVFGEGRKESGGGSRESSTESKESGSLPKESQDGSKISGDWSSEPDLLLKGIVEGDADVRFFSIKPYATAKHSAISSKELGTASDEVSHSTINSLNKPISKHKSSGKQDLTVGIGGILSKEVSSGLAVDVEVGDQYGREEFDLLTSLLPDDNLNENVAQDENQVSDGAPVAKDVPHPRSRRSIDDETKDVTPFESEQPMNIEALVRTLQGQVLESQTSQAHTRSILNTLQERQAAQERDIASLKADLSLFESQQNKDHTALETVHGLVSDAGWAIKDLKASTDQLHADFSAFKHNQQLQNDTMLELENDIGAAQDNQYGYTEIVKQLHRDVRHLKASSVTDRDTMARLKHMLSSLDWARKQMATRHEHENTIPLVPVGSGETSSGGSESNSFRSDNIASVFEETDNSIGHNIVELYKHKHHMHMQIDNVNKRFLQYDAEMSRVYAMYYNLSLQISALENKMLTRQQASVDTDMATLQRSFMNFTQQVFNAEQLHMATKSQLNTTSQNKQRIHRLSSSVDNHQMRIRTIENLLVDYRSTNTDFRRMLDLHLGAMNDSVVTFRGRFKDHKSKSTLTFKEVEERLAEVRKEVKHHNRRIMQVEVRSLNESLTQCKKVNEDMVQDMRIDQVRSNIRRLDAQVVDHTGLITRHDRSIGTLYKETQGNNRMIGEVMTQNKVLFDLIPRTATVEDEVSKLLMHLPLDCTKPLAENEHKDGVYLIKPTNLIRSVRVYCDADTAGSWLVIQRRESGTESFARTWDEYAKGFGSPDSEFWIGNDIIHSVTSQTQYRLHIDMWDLDDVYYFVQYDFFRVDDAETNYRISIDGYHGNATDALRYSNYMPFSTMDRDHDVSSTHCAKFYTSGWWYKHCHYSNLNGRYTVGVVWFNHDFDEWIQMKRTVMKIQPVNGVNATISATGR